MEISLKNNQRRPVSRLGVQIAEAQHRQALSGWWPTISLQAAFASVDPPPVFVFPASTFTVPAQSGVLPAGAFGPGFPPQDVRLPVPATQVTVPEQKVKLFDRSTLTSSLSLRYPLYTGGLITATADQAKAGLDAAREEVRRTDLRIVYDVRRMYYGLVLAREIRKVGQETLARMQATLEVTETMYKKGSGRVKKTDYLASRIAVESTRATLAQLEANEATAAAALTNVLGLPAETRVEPTAQEIPFQPVPLGLRKLIGGAYAFNPDWRAVEAGLRGDAAGVRVARSGHLPRVLLTGSLTHIDNPYNAGLVSQTNRNLVTLGVAMELPLFDGFLTREKAREAVARLRKREREQVLLRDGLALLIQSIVGRVSGAEGQRTGLREAWQVARENRALNERAYVEDLVETKDVITAQMTESRLQAELLKTTYDHADALAELEVVVGTELSRLMEEPR